MHGVADPGPEDGSENEEEPAKLRKCSGKRSEEWKILEDFTGDRDKAQEVLTDILLKQAESFGFKQHPYQRSKRMTGEGVLDHGELWHCKHKRKYGSTVTRHSHARSGAPHNADLRSSISSRTAEGVHVGRAQPRERDQEARIEIGKGIEAAGGDADK